MSVLEKLLPDWCSFREFLHYEWEGFSEVLIFALEAQPQALAVWYLEEMRQKCRRVDSGTYEIYFPTGHQAGAKESILFVDARSEEAFEDLTSYVGSPRFEALKAEGYQTVGVAFAHTAPWT